MGVEERKERDRHWMRNRILRAAMELFSKGGYKNVSMRRIAMKIEYSPGTIYRYFKKKDDIMLQLCYQGFEELLARQMKLEEIDDPFERLNVCGRYYVAFALENPDLYELMFATEEIVKQPEGEEETVALKSFGKLVNHVQDCLNAGIFCGEDAQTVAIGIWSALHGLSSLLIKQQLRFLPQDRVDTVVEKALTFHLRGNKKTIDTQKKDL
jgi:AcrR family transcriptional regulator